MFTGNFSSRIEHGINKFNLKFENDKSHDKFILQQKAEKTKITKRK